jgi:hypothetical protein
VSFLLYFWSLWQIYVSRLEFKETRFLLLMVKKISHRWINDAFIKVKARGGIWSHHESSWTDAGVAAGRIDALASITGILQANTFVNVWTGAPVHEEHVASIAAATVGARGVETNIIAFTIACGAFVNVLAAEATTCLAVALVTDALIGAHHVLTSSIGANAAGEAALVNVLAVTPVFSQLMTWGTLALEAARCVNAPTAAAQRRVTLTLIDVHAHLHHRHHLKASITFACETTLDIYAGAFTTHPSHDFTFINVHTANTILIQGIALIAATAEGAHRVLAASIDAHIGKGKTFIDIHLPYKSISFPA